MVLEAPEVDEEPLSMEAEWRGHWVKAGVTDPAAVRRLTAARMEPEEPSEPHWLDEVDHVPEPAGGEFDDE